eukprot:5396645-Prymnesium_polylepis.1
MVNHSCTPNATHQGEQVVSIATTTAAGWRVYRRQAAASGESEGSQSTSASCQPAARCTRRISARL